MSLASAPLSQRFYSFRFDFEFYSTDHHSWLSGAEANGFAHPIMILRFILQTIAVG
ncbi:hypothetical protein [Chryseobacterium sp. VD8]|uniref:hypothetical protein n=1 Tax=Chryseobacterium sp. VD8 TaxID=3081254 RepID=UPI0030166718